jgi:hypothetical protein
VLDLGGGYGLAWMVFLEYLLLVLSRTSYWILAMMVALSTVGGS